MVMKTLYDYEKEDYFDEEVPNRNGSSLYGPMGLESTQSFALLSSDNFPGCISLDIHLYF